MAYFVLYNHCYVKHGAKKAAIYDILQKRLIWVQDPLNRSFIEMAQHGLSVEEAAAELDADVDALYAYAQRLQHLDIGAIHGRKVVSTKFRPFATPFYQTHTGYTPGISAVTMEVASACPGNCPHCTQEGRAANAECACGIYSDTPRITYDIRAVVRGLSFAGVKAIELMGGDPYTNRGDVERIVAAAFEHDIAVRVKSSGALITPDDLAFLHRNNASLSLVLREFDPYEVNEADPVLERVSYLLDAAAEVGFFRIGVTLIASEAWARHIPQAEAGFREMGLPIWGAGVFLPKADLSARHALDGYCVTPFTRNAHIDFAVDTDMLARNLCGHVCWQDGLAIMANGDVAPCIASGALKYGNLCEKHILDIIREDRSDELTLAGNASNPECAACEFGLGCLSCSVAQHKVTGNYASKPFHCAYAPADGVFLVDA